MWLIPTRNRPKQMQELILAMQKSGCVPDAAVMMDGDKYDIEFPEHWHVYQSIEHLELSGALNELFRLHPDEKTYGFICDHGRPVSADWAYELEKAAGDWRIAICNSDRLHPVTNKLRLTEATCFGGELVRTTGWVWPDFVTHLYGDDVWEDIAHDLGLMVHCKHVHVDMLLFSKGEFPIDENHNRMFRGESFPAKDQSAYEVWAKALKASLIRKIEDRIPKKPLTVVCVKTGDMYGAEYVNILKDMVCRNLPPNLLKRMVCITDDPDGIDPQIDIIKTDIKGWWAKLYMFKKGLIEDDLILYLDLDTVITGGLDCFANYTGEFAILRDFYRPNGYGSGVMLWKGGERSYIWDSWDKAGRREVDGGDQAWIEIAVREYAEILQDLYPNKICSYKVSARKMFPKGSKICCFHGIPKPHEVTDGWIPHVWKIGGGTAIEMEYASNVAETELEKNIKFAIASGKPLLQMVEPHDGHAVIVGGAPSLTGSIEEIRLRKAHGQHVFVVNNAIRTLAANSIDADYHVILDARLENVEFVTCNTAKKYYATQCHPHVSRHADVLWHSFADGIIDVIASDIRSTELVGGGSTVLLKTIAMAYIMGYRNFHIFGADSSYSGENHHAYPQSLNDNERVIDVTCGGKTYKCAPWMISQVEDFKDLAAILVKDSVLTVHGRGLLPDVAASLSEI
jgi:hypothetical protein